MTTDQFIAARVAAGRTTAQAVAELEALRKGSPGSAGLGVGPYPPPVLLTPGGGKWT